MANGSDGSIVIDTELDNEGFEKGSEKLLSSIKEFGDKIAKAGGDIKESFQEIMPVLRTIAASTAQINSKIAGTATQTAEANVRVADSEQRVAQAAEAATQAVNRQGQSMGTLSSGASAAQQGVSALEKEVSALTNGMASISRSAESGFANGNAVLAFDAKLSDMEAKLTAAREKLEAFAQTKIPTEDYQWLTNAVAKAEAEYDKLIERQDRMKATGVKQNAKAWENLRHDISSVRRKIAEYRVDMAELERTGGAFITGADTEQFQHMQTSINQTAAELQRNKSLIDQEALAQARLNVLTAQEAVAAASTSSEREAALERLRTAQQQLNDLAASMSNKPGNTEPSEESISGWQRFGAAIKSAASAALRMTGSLAKIGFGAIKKGISGIVGKLKEFTKQGHKSRSMAETLTRSLTSLKRMLITRIKRMFISSIFNSAKESLQSLAQFSDAFNQAMSNIKNSAKGLSANLAVSLGGLISAIEPVLTKIINMISTAISYLNAFFALLSGKATMTIAKKQTDNYAKSLGGAAGAAEELKRQVYGFDELNKRSSNDSGGGGGGGGAGDLFEEVPIDSLLPDSVKDFFQSIKDAIAAGNWREVGKTLADSITTLITEINWGEIAGLLSDAIIGLLDFAIGFVETLDWGKLTDALWNGLLDVITSIDYGAIIRSAVELLGAAVGAAASVVATLALNIWDLLKEGWETVKTYFGEYITQFGGDIVAGLWAGIKNAFVNVGQWIWDNIFLPFWDGLCSAFGIHSPSTKMMEIGGFLIEGLLNGITETWNKITAFFSTALSNLKATLSNAWDNIKSTASTAWSNIKTKVTNAFDTMKTSLVNAANNIKTNISNAWDNIKSKSSTIWDSVKSTVSTSFTNLKNSLQNTTNTIKSNLSTAWDNVKSTASTKWENVKSTITTKWNALKTTLNNTDWKSVGTNICNGIKNGIDAGWSWLKNTVSNLASNLLYRAKSALGIASPSKVFRDEVGKFIGLGLAEGISDTESTVVKTVKNLAEATVDGFDAEKLTLGAPASATISGLDMVADKLSGIAEVFREITSSILAIDGLRVPEIALGKFCPAQLKIDVSALPDADALSNDEFKSFASGLDERMSDLLYKLRQFMDMYDKRSRSSITLDDLTAAITSKQRATARSFGR